MRQLPHGHPRRSATPTRAIKRKAQVSPETRHGLGRRANRVLAILGTRPMMTALANPGHPGWDTKPLIRRS